MKDRVDLDNRVGYAIKRAQHAQRTSLDDALRDLGITMPQWAALMCLHNSEGLTNADLARVNDCTPQSMNAIVLHLETNGLLERSHHPHHGTVLPARLTPAGRELMQRGFERVLAVEARMLESLNDAERRLLIDLLNRCIDGLQRELPASRGTTAELIADASS